MNVARAKPALDEVEGFGVARALAQSEGWRVEEEMRIPGIRTHVLKVPTSDKVGQKWGALSLKLEHDDFRIGA